jgi:hypothetical protein
MIETPPGYIVLRREAPGRLAKAHIAHDALRAFRPGQAGQPINRHPAAIHQHGWAGIAQERHHQPRTHPIGADFNAEQRLSPMIKAAKGFKLRIGRRRVAEGRRRGGLSRRDARQKIGLPDQPLRLPGAKPEQNDQNRQPRQGGPEQAARHHP